MELGHRPKKHVAEGPSLGYTEFDQAQCETSKRKP